MLCYVTRCYGDKYVFCLNILMHYYGDTDISCLSITMQYCVWPPPVVTDLTQIVGIYKEAASPGHAQ